MKLSQNSLFAVLLRSPWWVSALVAIAIVMGLRLMVPDVYAVFGALPVVVLAVYVAWKQLRAPSPARIAATLERLRAMPWEDFSRALGEAFGREGCTVKALEMPQADFELVLGSHVTLVACKRWKATRTGVEPLRELEAARSAREAHKCIYFAAGEITAQARAFAAEKKIRLVEGEEIAKKIVV